MTDPCALPSTFSFTNALFKPCRQTKKCKHRAGLLLGHVQLSRDGIVLLMSAHRRMCLHSITLITTCSRAALLIRLEDRCIKEALISTSLTAGRSMTSSRFIHLPSNSCKCISPLINLLSVTRYPLAAEVSQHDIELGNKHRQKLAEMRSGIILQERWWDSLST